MAIGDAQAASNYIDTITSTFLTLLVVPLLYEWLERKTKPRNQQPIEL